MAFVLRDDPDPSHDHRFLDVVELQVFQGYPGDCFYYHQRILNVTLGEGPWILTAPTWGVYAGGLRDDGLEPMDRDIVVLLGDRPIFAFGEVPAEQMATVSGRAFALSEVMEPVLTDVSGDSCWRFSDIAVPVFAQVVELGIIERPGRSATRDGVALVQVLLDGQLTWSAAERE